VTALLDTHVWLWMLTDPDRLVGRARVIVEDAATVLLLSAASSWEIAIKHALGRLPLPEPPERYVPERMRATAVDPLPIGHAHALRVNVLPNLHRDPFDRLLVAQAQLERIPLVTSDPVFDGYDVDVISAQ
jgi:PIN domain nuclease of toxin-antitoxin system